MDLILIFAKRETLDFLAADAKIRARVNFIKPLGYTPYLDQTYLEFSITPFFHLWFLLFPIPSAFLFHPKGKLYQPRVPLKGNL